MASQISPGIVLRERDITTATIVGAQSLTAAFATTFTKGPVDRITAIASQREFIDTFGLPTEGNAEDWFVASEFLNYGGRLAVVRALTDGINTANTDDNDSLVVKNELDWLGNNYSTLFAARSPGKWGNSVKVVVVDRGADQYIELDSIPENVSTAPGSLWEFTNGNSGYVLSWDSISKKAAIVLTDPENTLSVEDKLNDGEPISVDPDGISHNGVAQAIRVPGTYSYTDAGGAEFDVTIAAVDNGITTFTHNGAAETVRTPGVYSYTAPGGAAFSVTIASVDNGIDTFTHDGATDPGRTPGTYTYGAPGGAQFEVLVAGDGSLTITKLANGSGYAVNDTIVIPNAAIGGGSDITITVTALDVDGGAVSVSKTANGSGYIVGSTIVIPNASIGGGSNITVTVTGIDIDGGAVTVDLIAGGSGYLVGDTILIPGSSIGGGNNVTVTVTSLTPSTGTDIDITAAYDWYTNTSISVGNISVPLNSLGGRPGTSQYAADRGIKYDELSVAVIDIDGKISGTVGNVVERRTSLSKLSDGRSTENGIVYYKTIINDQSQYVFTGSNTVTSVLTDASTGSADFVSWDTETTDIVDNGLGTSLNICGVQEFVLTAGADDYTYTPSEITDAYDKFSSSDETELDFLLMGGSMSDEDGTKTKAAKIVQIAAARKDCIAFVSPHKGNQIGTGGVSLSAAQQKTNTINFFRNLTSTSYAVFDSGYKYLYDRFNDRYRYVACNGDVAGLCVNTSATLADWYSPAGVARGALRNAIKLAYNPSAADRDDLYTNRINPVTTLPGTGITLFGDKTALASTSAFDRINVRRLFLNIEKRVEKLASGVLFEQNDVLTRSSFSSAVNSYLSEVQARRGVTDFLVVCDETNNTPDVIDRNEFVAEIFVKAARSINFVNITFTATKTGVAFAEVVGR